MARNGRKVVIVDNGNELQWAQWSADRVDCCNGYNILAVKVEQVLVMVTVVAKLKSAKED